MSFGCCLMCHGHLILKMATVFNFQAKNEGKPNTVKAAEGKKFFRQCKEYLETNHGGLKAAFFSCSISPGLLAPSIADSEVIFLF